MNINLRLRNIFYGGVILLLLWFIYIESRILTPFILAMIFAYIFNPLINFFQRKLHIPRSLSIIVVYILLIVSVTFAALIFTRSLLAESISIKQNFELFFRTLRHDVRSFPDWAQPYAYDYLDYFSKNPYTINSSPFPVFTKAFSGILGVFIFLFASFFFLKDSNTMISKLLEQIPHYHKDDIDNLLSRINGVLSSYLRGQMILIVSMIVMLMLCFTILGVKYGFTISILSALFEIVPVLGPIVSAILGTTLIIISGGIHNFDFSMMQSIIIILLIYYSTRLIQDYLIQPYVIGRATKLHPLVILFSVLAGEHLYGVLGVLLAVPVAATLKILFEFVNLKIQKVDFKKLRTKEL